MSLKDLNLRITSNAATITKATETTVNILIGDATKFLIIR